MADSQQTKRLFFALWPDDAQRQAMVEWIEGLELGNQGRPVVTTNLHITLVFLGDTPSDRLECIVAAAGAVSAAPFSLRFDHLGYFRRAQVLWAGVSDLPPVVTALHRHLEQALVPCGYRPEPRAFTPHLTLRRKVARKPELKPLATPLEWKIEQFCLIASTLSASGAEYEVLKHFPLAA